MFTFHFPHDSNPIIANSHIRQVWSPQHARMLRRIGLFVRPSLVFRIRSPLLIPIHAKQIGILLTHRFLIRPSFQSSIYTYYRLYLQISSPSHQHNLLQQMLEPLFSIIAPLPVSVNSLSPSLNEVFCFRRDFVSSCFCTSSCHTHFVCCLHDLFARAALRPAVSQSVSQSWP